MDIDVAELDRIIAEQQLAAEPSAETINGLGAAYFTRYYATGTLGDLDHAVDTWELLVAQTEADSPQLAMYLTNLCVALEARLEAVSQQRDLEWVITLYERLLAIEPTDSPARIGHLHNLAVNLGLRNLVSGTSEDRDWAIECCMEALNLAPTDSSDRSLLLSQLGARLFDRFAATGDIDDLDHAIRTSKEAVDSLPADDARHAAYFADVSSLLRERYRFGSDVTDLERALQYAGLALRYSPPGTPDRSRVLLAAGAVLRMTYLVTGDRHELDRAVDILRAALGESRRDPREDLMVRQNLATALLDRFTASGDVEDATQAMLVLEEIIGSPAITGEQRAILLTAWASAVRIRALTNGAGDDLARVISALKEAVRLTPPGSIRRADHVSNLGKAMLDAYRQTGETAQLDHALACFDEAVDLASRHDRAAHLNNLSDALRQCYERDGNPANLERAIAYQEEAVAAVLPGSPERPLILNNLGNRWRDRYGHTGSMEDLERAIAAHTEVIRGVAPEAPNAAIYFSNLGADLSFRFARTGALSDLEHEIEAHEHALGLARDGHPSRPMILNNLGARLVDRYELTGDASDLIRACELCSQALSLATSHAPERPMFATNLANALFARYARSGVDGDLDEAIRNYELAVEETPVKSPFRATSLNNLGVGLSARFQRHRTPQDLDRALEAWRTGADANDDPQLLPICMANYGAGLLEQYELLDRVRDLDLAVRTLEKALRATADVAPHAVSLLTNAGWARWARHGIRGKDVDLRRAIAHWERAVRLIGDDVAVVPVPYQLGRQFDWADLESHLVFAYYWSAFREPAKTEAHLAAALMAAERSKSRLLSQLVAGAPLAEPVGVPRALLDREQFLVMHLTDLSAAELASHGQAATEPQAARVVRLRERRESATELRQIWDEMTATGPEGQSFVELRRGDAPTWSQVRDLLDELGPSTAILSLAVTRHRSLLFVARQGWPAPRVVVAPLGPDEWADVQRRIFAELYRPYQASRFGDTWYGRVWELVAPAASLLDGVERAVVIPQSVGHLLPWAVVADRAGWCDPTGRRLPLVSLPALSVLQRLRRQAFPASEQTLVVGDPCANLPFARSEAKEVAASLGTVPIVGDQATVERVLSELTHASVIHVAAHASFDSDHPLDSGVVLANGILRARDILRQRLRADLLVLSACETGLAGSLAGNEVAGLAHAFLAAGVRSIVMSLWRVDDEATALLMRRFHEQRSDGNDTARALRDAADDVRAVPRWQLPHSWGSFSIMGNW